MPVYKINYIFNAKKYGWTETWYKEADTKINEVFLLAQEYLGPRRAVLGYFADIEAIKVTDLSTPNRTLVGRVPPGELPAVTPELERADNVWSALLVQVYDLQGWYHRSFALRGTYDKALVTGASGEVFTSAVKARVDGVAAVLKKLGFCFRTLTRLDKTNQREIYDAVPTTDRGSIVLAVKNHGLANGNYVTIRRAKGPARKYLNGVKRVVFIDGDTVSIPGPIPADFVWEYDGQGVLAKRDYALRFVESFEFRRYTHRDTGRPLFLSLGHQKKRP